MGRSAGLLLFLFLAGCATAEPEPSELSAFRFGGKPIHPAIIDAFIPWLSDGEPVIAAVDLEGFTRSSNRLCGWTVRESKGRVAGAREESGDSISYWHLGKTRRGTHFVEVLESGNGSASWRYLMELRFEVVHAFKSRRILLRCDNVEWLSCCSWGLADKELVPGPCERHPRPIPDIEPSDVAKAGPPLADSVLLRSWDSYVARENLRLGKIRVFPHSIFIERQGLVPFTMVEATDGKCLLRLATEVDSDRFLVLETLSSLTPAPPTLKLSFHSTLEEGRSAFTGETQWGSTWGVADQPND